MSYIVVTRNPHTKRLVVITETDHRDNDLISEFPDDDAARAMAEKQVVCRAWGYDVLEVAL